MPIDNDELDEMANVDGFSTDTDGTEWIARTSLVVIWGSSQNKHIIEAVVLAQIWQAPRSGGQREPVPGERDPGGDLELEVRVRRGRRCVFRFVCEACDI
jgi:hypothetical protein